MRVFVAVVPPAPAVEDLDAFLDPRRDVPGPRWLPSAEWHVTLAFMADAPSRVLEPLVEALRVVAAGQAPVPIAVSGGGCFPDVTRATVLWAGIAGGEAVAPLAGGVRSAAAVVGAAPAGGRFRPHLTVARFPRPVDASRWLHVLDTYTGPEWIVGEVVVVESHLPRERGHRPRHDVLARLPLGG
ncbi:RNA 2',3'-cyclic phosphodiesterase [uncultured Phycicoccus sp.]|uniref:RNA 2',3'-cyclic phosphodiesterase n=1 Tax=uncultured Phycicoccus sp. TaxID=661422 RepID=UPI0026116756|nr:RNA 2',3'-cyclic phosphodiesterase [uncultured Phycicoccus sp.]